MDRKKLMKILVAVFFAVIFVVSYSTVFNFGAPVAGTTTVPAEKPALYATGYDNATVFGYAPFMNISVSCGSAALDGNVIADISGVVSSLQANNTVSTFYPLGNTIVVESGSANTFDIYNRVLGRLNATEGGCVGFSSGVLAMLPQQIMLDANSNIVHLALTNSSRNYEFSAAFSNSMSETVPVRIAALLTSNGTLYGNLSVTEVKGK